MNNTHSNYRMSSVKNMKSMKSSVNKNRELLSGRTMKRKKGFFSISAVAEMFGIHQQTIRLYEREGLINPKRSEGNTRLFSEEDVDRLETVIYLTHTLGINLAGVQMIIKLQKQIKKMQNNMNTIFDETTQDLEKQASEHKKEIAQSSQELAKLKPIKQLTCSKKTQEKTSHEAQEITQEADNWQIDYED